MSTPQPREPQLRRRSPLPGPEEELRRLAAVSLEDDLGGDFDRHLERAGLAPLTATGIEVLQVNVGKLCNQTCAHCHVDAGPDRKEVMSADTAAACLRALEANVAVLGVIGAGGIGGTIAQTLQFKQFEVAGLGLVIVVLATIAVDLASGAIRRRILRGPPRDHSIGSDHS